MELAADQLAFQLGRSILADGSTGTDVLLLVRVDLCQFSRVYGIHRKLCGWVRQRSPGCRCRFTRPDDVWRLDLALPVQHRLHGLPDQRLVWLLLSGLTVLEQAIPGQEPI